MIMMKHEAHLCLYSRVPNPQGRLAKVCTKQDDDFDEDDNACDCSCSCSSPVNTVWNRIQQNGKVCVVEHLWARSSFSKAIHIYVFVVQHLPAAEPLCLTLHVCVYVIQHMSAIDPVHYTADPCYWTLHVYVTQHLPGADPFFWATSALYRICLQKTP